jgi:hypothetical protein
MNCVLSPSDILSYAVDLLTAGSRVGTDRKRIKNTNEKRNIDAIQARRIREFPAPLADAKIVFDEVGTDNGVVI